jgi:antitoxin HigA-1
MNYKTKLQPIHPGEILVSEFLEPMNISQNQLSQDINVSLQTINQICLGKRAITAATSLLLGKYFGLSENFWLTIQNRYDNEFPYRDTCSPLTD